MRLQFFIRYYTKPGESLFLTGNIAALGNNDDTQLFPLYYHDHEHWTGTLEVDPQSITRVHYSYVFRGADGQLVHEGGEAKTVDVDKAGVEEIQLVDSWVSANAYENVFYTDPFQEVLLAGHHPKIKARAPKSFTHIFRVKAPLLKKHQAVCLLGSGAAMGDWDLQKPLLLHYEHGYWTAKLKVAPEGTPLIYKYGVYDVKQKHFVGYEAGENRSLNGNGHTQKLTLIHDGFVWLPNNTWRGAGVSIPVFSLRTKDSFGVGEFNDIKVLSDWAEKTGLKLIQLLPVNDTTASHTWKDSYPYAAVSAFALHPIYINLEAIAGKHNAHVRAARKLHRQLNESPDLDYEQVMAAKLTALQNIFQDSKDEFLKDEDFLEFFSKSRHWLVPYAAFTYLRDRNGTADFSKWKIYGAYNRLSIERYVSPKAKHYDAIALTYFIQYHLHLQLTDAVEYAHRNGIIIKGDLAIGVSRHSCDAWMQPSLFHMDMQAGAPPDDFAVKGQNWDFPTYNWEKMAATHFDWWQKRFAQMALYFDVFRIDHILGFFRIWSIPIDAVEGIMGRFIPALPVHIYDFAQRGMWFNYHRFCKPYITDAVLWEMFGPNKDKFFPFLDSLGNNQYELKPEFATQRAVQAHFATLEDDAENGRIREGLYDLISNVILFEQAGSNGQEFHFRISMEHTTSFRHLDWNMQQQLKALSNDYFYHRQNEFWRKEGLKKLPHLKRSTNMLICGEDLGMVPPCVPEVMSDLGILSLDVQRMPKDNARQFFSPRSAPYLSVVTPSTHDMSTIRGWWEENRQTTQAFYNQELGQSGEAPAICEGWINKSIVQQHLQSPAMWSIFQWQDLIGMDEELRRPEVEQERVNIPAVPNFYWKYRMHMTLDQLLRQKEFNHELEKMVSASGR